MNFPLQIKKTWQTFYGFIQNVFFLTVNNVNKAFITVKQNLSVIYD